MKLLTASTALLLAIVGSQAMAEPAKTRAQVKAEFAEAIRTGDILGPGDSGLKLNELYPNRYPAAAKAQGKTRDEVKAELVEAFRTGDVIVGESARKLNEIRPDLYPATATGPGKTRDQVKAELAEAIQTGDILAGGDSLLKQNELHPDRYQSATRMAKASGDKLNAIQ